MASIDLAPLPRRGRMANARHARHAGAALWLAHVARALAAARAFAAAPVIAALAGCTALSAGYADPRLDALFNAERTFARAASLQGTRPAFLQFMAPDAVIFAPGPTDFHANLATRPVPANPRIPRLEWAPQDGAVAGSDDLAFDTGPYRVMKSDALPPIDQGYFFSIWKRIDGNWRVAVDAGVQTVAPPPQEGLANFLVPIVFNPATPPASQQAQASRSKLLARERSPRALTADGAALPSYFEWITVSTRWLRNGPSATFGSAMRAELAADGGRIEWVPVDGAVAASDDLAYTYGSFTRTTADGRVLPGYYVHVWRRDDYKDWKLAAVVWLPPK